VWSRCAFSLRTVHTGDVRTKQGVQSLVVEPTLLGSCLWAAQAAAEGIINDTHASWRKLVATPADDSIKYGLDALQVLKPKLWTA
jgi:hypothetical protein